MIRHTHNFLLCTFLLCLLFSSCIDNIDFEQAEDLEVSPTMEASLIYFDEPASSFVDNNGVETIVERDTVGIDVFADGFIYNNLVKADFLFEGTNTINRAYEAQIDFLNDDFELQHTFTLAIPASPNNFDITVEEVEVFEGMTLEALKLTTQLVLIVRLLPSDDGSILDENSPGNLRFRSKATLYFNIGVF